MAPDGVLQPGDAEQRCFGDGDDRGDRDGGSLSNTATVSSSTDDPNTANNSATATTTVNQPATHADLSITKGMRRIR